MERLWALEDTRDIKVITGMRRSGKSELMKAFSASAAREDPSSNNVYIDLLDLDNEPLLEYHALHREISIVDDLDGALVSLDELHEQGEAVLRLRDADDGGFNANRERPGRDVFVDPADHALRAYGALCLLRGC